MTGFIFLGFGYQMIHQITSQVDITYTLQYSLTFPR